MNFKKMKLEDLKKLAMEKIPNSKKEILINFYLKFLFGELIRLK